MMWCSGQVPLDERFYLATKILLQCSRNNDVFFITQEDNGKGFELNEGHTENGTGLKNIRNRVGFLKGKIDRIDN